MKKVILVTNIPTPYRIPLFNEIDRQLKKNKIEFKVLFAALGYSRRKWKINLDACRFQYEFLRSRSFQLKDEETTSFSYSQLLRKILLGKPDVVIVGGFSIATMKLWLCSWFFHIPYIIWSGDIPSRSSRYSFLRTIQKKLLVNRAQGFVAYGTLAKEYLVSLGASPDKVEVGINTVDTEFFRKGWCHVKNHRNAGRKQLLTVGHLTPRKNVIQLLKIIKILHGWRDDFILNIVGDGSERSALERYTSNNGLTDCVVFHGFKQARNIVVYMSSADCFLFPTNFDIWGLVLVEAMAAGVPCIASIHAGATRDLIHDGKTGFCVDFSSVNSVVEILIRLLDDDVLSDNIAKNAIQLIKSKATIQHSSMGFLKVVENVVTV